MAINNQKTINDKYILSFTEKAHINLWAKFKVSMVIISF